MPPSRLRPGKHDRFSVEGAEHLARVAADGTLKGAFTEMAAGDPELVG